MFYKQIKFINKRY